jgi:hypothetical protein
VVLTKSKYMELLEIRIRREQDQRSKAIRSSATYKGLIKLEKKISSKIKALENQGVSRAKDKWIERDNIRRSFSEAWDNMLLIIDNKRRKAEQIEILKRFNLYR